LSPYGKQRTATCDLKTEAQACLDSNSVAARRGEWRDPALARTTVKEWADEWQATTVHLEPSTRAWYESMLGRHVLPAFGRLPVGAVEQVHVRQFVAGMVADG